MASMVVFVLLAAAMRSSGARKKDIESSFQYISSDEVPQIDYLKLPIQMKLIPGLRNRRDAASSPDETVTLSMQDFKTEPGSAVLPSSTVISLAVPLMRLSNQTTTTFPSVTQDHSTVIADNGSLLLQTPVESTVKPATQNFTIVEDDHRYYRSRVATAKEQESFWIDEETMYNASHHDTLSESYRSAATIQLGFTFTFYGHEINQITIATGGFLYMSDFLHQWLTATQYIAPLMANFDTQLGNTSHIRYMDNGTVFVVWWQDVYLQDSHDVGCFSFQVMLHKDGRIIFSYKQVPLTALSNLSSQRHPVKVGLSDAYYVDKSASSGNSGTRQRTIYEYHRVEINMSQVINKSAIIISPLPTCLSLKTCDDCVNLSSTVTSSFECHWCPSLGKCSDGIDRSRQEWLGSGCEHMFPDTVDKCADAERQSWAGSRMSLVALAPAGGVSVLTAVVLAAVILMIGSVLGWFVYAYRNPNSRSGLWLIQHRPNNLIERIRQLRSGFHIASKYEVTMLPETESLA